MSKQNANQIRRILEEEGFSSVAIAGALARMRAESNFNPKAVAKNDAGKGNDSVGIFQWNRDRLANLKKFAKGRGEDWQGVKAQARFFAHEAKTTEKTWGSRLLNAKTAEQAAEAAISMARPQGWTSKNPRAGHGWKKTAQWAKEYSADRALNRLKTSKPEEIRQAVNAPDDSGILTGSIKQVQDELAKAEAPVVTAAQAAGVSESVAKKNPMELAEGLVGLGEVPDRKALMDYMLTGGVSLDPATTAWCAAFVNATLLQSGIEGTGTNLARDFLKWGDEVVGTPEPGDLAVFSRGDPNGWQGHVGFFKGFNEDGSINVLGGNQGDSVNVSAYDSSRLLGFRRAPQGSGTPASLEQSISGLLRGPLDLQGESTVDSNILTNTLGLLDQPLEMSSSTAFSPTTGQAPLGESAPAEDEGAFGQILVGLGSLLAQGFAGAQGEEAGLPKLSSRFDKYGRSGQSPSVGAIRSQIGV